MIDQIIWSKNRPAQLDLLLRSQKEFATGIESTLVLYSANGGIFRKGYDRCRHLHPEIMWLRETDFRGQILRAMTTFTNEMLLGNSDDNVWINPVDLSDVCLEPWVVALSLRLNPHVNLCQPASLAMEPPRLLIDVEGPPAGYQELSSIARSENTRVGLYVGDQAEIRARGPFPGMIWRWDICDPRGCWGYPQPCDSNVYRRKWWQDLLARADFRNPGTMEDYMNTHRDKLRRYMRCFDRSKITNICNNRVQSTSTCPSSCGWEPEVLAREFVIGGKQISLAPFRHLQSKQCHQSLEFIWEAP
jgi:hypothetical protein